MVEAEKKATDIPTVYKLILSNCQLCRPTPAFAQWRQASCLYSVRKGLAGHWH